MFSAYDTTDDNRKAQLIFRNQNLEKLCELRQKTKFNETELDALAVIYFKIKSEADENYKKNHLHITRTQFRTFLHKCLNMPEDILMDRVIGAMDNSGVTDGVATFVTLEIWILALNLFLRGTLEQKIKFCFRVYDMLGDGFIRRDQLITLMRNSMMNYYSEEDLDEAVKDFVDILLKKFDLDHDGSIGLADFAESVRRQPLLLEAFGPCLPDRYAAFSLNLQITHALNKF